MGIAVEDDISPREVDETADLGRNGYTTVGDGEEEGVATVQPHHLPARHLREMMLMIFPVSMGIAGYKRALVAGYPVLAGYAFISAG